MAQLTDAEAFPLAKRTRIEMLRHCYFLLFHAVMVRTVRECVRIARGRWTGDQRSRPPYG